MVAALAVTRDVAEHKPDESRQAYLAGLLDNTDDAIAGIDAAGRVTICNPGAERLYGYMADEVLGRHARELATYDGERSRDALARELRDVAFPLAKRCVVRRPRR